MAIASFRRAACVALFGVLATGAAHAVYRCGNVYQDRPCDERGPQAHLTPGMKATPAPSAINPASPFAAVCSRAGEEAQKVAWKREGGATQERQLAEIPANVSRSSMTTLIESVYRKRGTAPEIRAAIEAECVVDKQKEADAAAALKLLQQSQQSGSAAPQAAPAPAAEPAAAQRTSATAANPSCPAWRSALDSANADLRRGGSAADMERRQTRRREIEQKMRDGRC